MTTRTSARARALGPAAWLGAALVALLIALLMPGLALGEEGATAVQDPSAIQAEPPAAETTPAEEPEATAPPATPEPPPVPDPPAQPDPPATVDEIETPAPPPAEIPSDGAVVPDEPAVAPSLPELVPTIPEVIGGLPIPLPELPILPDAPRAKPPVVLSDVVVLPADQPGKPPVASAGGLRLDLVAPSAPALDIALLGAPAPPDQTPPPAKAPERVAPLGGSGFAPALGALEPARTVSAVPATARPQGPGPAELAGDDEGHNPFATSLGAPGGPAPAGSSLLAVLASYVLPGGGSLPATTLFLFVQLAVILAAACAPRPGVFERLVAMGLLGARAGHRLAVARPG